MTEIGQSTAAGAGPYQQSGVLKKLSTLAPALAARLPTWCDEFVLQFPLEDDSWWAVRELCVDAVMAEPDRPLSYWLPGLTLLEFPVNAGHALPSGLAPLGSRAWNALLDPLLERSSSVTWSGLGRLTVRDIRRLPGLGDLGARDWVRWLLDLSVRVDVTTSRPFELEVQGEDLITGGIGAGPSERFKNVERREWPDSPEPTPDQRAANALAPLLIPLSRVAVWASSEAGQIRLSEAISLGLSESAPEDIRDAAGQLQALGVPKLAVGDLSQLMEELLSAELSGNRRHIFEARIISPTPETLESIGKRYGITRERARQIEKDALRAVVRAIRTEKYRLLRWRGQTLRAKLGPVFPDGHPHVTASIHSTFGRSASPLLGLFLIWLAGPYRLSEKLWRNEGSRAWRRIELEVLQGIDEQGDTTETLTEMLVERGVVRELAADVLASTPGLHFVQGRYFWRKPTIADISVVVLQDLGQPATVAKLADIIGGVDKLRNLSARVQADPRIVRVSKDEYALREWGLEEYSGVADAISRAITANGGMTSISELVSTIPLEFGVSAATVRAYMEAPMFVAEGDGVRLRREGELFTVEDRVPYRPRVYRFPSRIVLFLDVTSESLRGSGRSLVPDVVMALGVRPGETRTFTGEGFEVNIGWPVTGWIGGWIGSIRAAVASAEARLGGEIRLELNVETSTVSVLQVSPEATSSLPLLEAIQHLTGVNAETAEEAVAKLNRALGAPLAGLEAHLRNRGDGRVADLVQQIEG